MSVASNKWYQKHKVEVANKKRQTRQIIENKSVTCRVCQQTIGVKGLALHLKLHNIKFLNYVFENIKDFKQFGWQWCSHCKEIPVKSQVSANRNWTTCSDECKRAMMSKTRKGRQTTLGYKFTDEQLERLSKSHKGKNIGDLNPARRPEVRAKISQKMKENAAQSNYINPMQGKTHTAEAIQKIFKDRHMTKPELKIAELLDSKQINYYSQFFVVKDGSTFSYDFKIKGHPIIVEVDGDYWHGGPGVKTPWPGINETKENDKRKDEVATSQGYKVLRLWESDIKSSPGKCLKRIEELI